MARRVEAHPAGGGRPRGRPPRRAPRLEGDPAGGGPRPRRRPRAGRAPASAGARLRVARRRRRDPARRLPRARPSSSTSGPRGAGRARTRRRCSRRPGSATATKGSSCSASTRRTSAATRRRFVERYGLTYPIAFDGQRREPRALRQHRLPGDVVRRPRRASRRRAHRRAVRPRAARGERAGGARHAVAMRRLLLLARPSCSRSLAAGCGGEDEQSPRRFAELEKRYICPTCHTTLELSNAPIADRMRVVHPRADRGRRLAEEIDAALVDNFGEGVLAAPPKEGFNLLAWVLPLVARRRSRSARWPSRCRRWSRAPARGRAGRAGVGERPARARPRARAPGRRRARALRRLDARPPAQPLMEAKIPLAFAAGLVSFATPCVLPLVPGYLAVVSGQDVGVGGGASFWPACRSSPASPRSSSRSAPLPRRPGASSARTGSCSSRSRGSSSSSSASP